VILQPLFLQSEMRGILYIPHECCDDVTFLQPFFYPFRSEQFPHLFSSTVIIPRDNLDAPITSQEALIQTKRLTQVLETRYVDDTLIPGMKKLLFFSYIIFIFCYNIFLYCSNSSVST
jgi:hypothetical protein